MHRRNRKLLAIITILWYLSSGTAIAGQDLPRLVLTQDEMNSFAIAGKDPDGQKTFTFNAPLFSEKLEMLWAWAGNYPPKFSTEAEKQEAVRIADYLMGLMGIMKPQFESVGALMAARLYNVGYNMDMPTAYGQELPAIKYYELAIKHDPKDPSVYYYYAAFLVSIGDPDASTQAIQLATQAIQLGERDARRTLTHAYINLGQTDKAIEVLDSIITDDPSDQKSKNFRDAIKNGTIKKIHSFEPGDLDKKLEQKQDLLAMVLFANIGKGDQGPDGEKDVNLSDVTFATIDHNGEKAVQVYTSEKKALQDPMSKDMDYISLSGRELLQHFSTLSYGVRVDPGTTQELYLSAAELKDLFKILQADAGIDSKKP